MNTLEFLTRLWPAEGNGVYCLAVPFTPPGETKTIFSHKVFPSIAAAAAAADARKLKDNIFYCVHTLHHDKVWNAKKKDRRTGKLGAWEVRVQTNMSHCKAFFFDLDVGEEETKYQSQGEALAGLKDFCVKAKLPKPMIVSSGGGLHVYWIMTEAMDTDQWRDIAAKLKRVAQHHGLKLDPSRTTDSASVLRVAGTFNLKKDAPRPVKVYHDPKDIDVVDFEELLDTALAANQLVVQSHNVPALPDDFNNTQKIFDGPPITIRSLLHACGQIARVAKLGGRVSEPEWYAALSSVRLVENGQKYVHKISEKHPSYSAAETNAKVAQLEAKGLGPTGCDKWHDLQPDICEACPLWGRVKGPLVAARKRPAALPQKPVEFTIGDVTVQEVIPPPPKDYKFTNNGLVIYTTNERGDPITKTIYEHNIFPLRRIVNKKAQVEEQLWRVELPRSTAPHDFTIPAPALYERREFVKIMANNGVFIAPENLKEVENYMIAYIGKLQQLSDADNQFNHLGWNDDRTGFILPDKMLLANGKARRVSLSMDAQRRSAYIHKQGTLQKQIELLNFYNHHAYIPQQFYILCALAAPLFYMTGHHGVIVNASGKTGSSKSSALYTAAAFWGSPKEYVINGTARGASANARDGRLGVLANLPVGVDEITFMEPKDVHDLAMSVTQPGYALRNNRDGTERATSDAYKATILMTTANSSLHSVLSSKNTAGTASSMRVFEIPMKAGAVHSKSDADDYLLDLCKDFGHIGEVFMAYVIKNLDTIEARLRQVMREIDVVAKVTSGERFWSAVVASAVTAGEIALSLGLTPFDLKPIKQWVAHKQIPYMRGVVREEYSNPVTVLTDFFEENNEHILIIQKSMANNNVALASKMPRGALKARYEQETGRMYVLKAAFKQHCTRIGANDRLCLEDLHAPYLDVNGVERRVVLNKHTRKVLGAGTELDKGQSHVFVVDMTHPLITGIIPSLSAKGGPNPKE